MNTSIQTAFAKINLHLDITGIMNNGFHSVNTVMQSISLYDTVTVTKRSDNTHTVACNVQGVPTDSSNLAIKAALAFEKATDLNIGADIYIEKHIPMAAGLAGGSADAAAVLKGLNALCGNILSTDELCRIGSSLGSDVPFCIVGGSRFADGKGDILHPYPAMPDCSLLIACGGEGVSTPMAYRLLDELYNGFSTNDDYSPHSLEALHSALEAKSITAVANAIYNIFESPILSIRPTAAKIKQAMLDNGALTAMMSGSGPSVFGIFENEADAISAGEKIRSIGVIPHVCKPVLRFNI